MAETGLKIYALAGSTQVHLLRPGTRWGKGAGSQTRESLSGAVRVGGLIVPNANVNLFPTDVGTCLLGTAGANVLPASLGALPTDLALTLGNSKASYAHTAWKVNELEVNLEINGALELNYKLVALTEPTAGAASAPAEIVRTTFEWYRGSVTGESAKKLQRVALKFGNNIVGVPDLATKASDKRYPTSIEPGPFTCSAEVDYQEPSGLDPGADELPPANLEIIAMNAATAAQTITISITGMKVPEEYFEAAAGAAWGQYKVP